MGTNANNNNMFDLSKLSSLLGSNNMNMNGNSGNNTSSNNMNNFNNNNNNSGYVNRNNGMNNMSNPLKALGNLFNLGGNNSRGRNRCAVNVLPIEEAYRRIKTGNVFLLDVRTEMEYKTVRVKGSVNIPLDRLQQDISKYNLNKQDCIIIYCSVGSRARRGIQILWNMGYTNICIWEGAGLNHFAFQDLIVYNSRCNENNFNVNSGSNLNIPNVQDEKEIKNETSE